MLDFNCVSNSPGLIMKLHPSDELPNFLHDNINIQFGEMTSVEIIPKITSISPSLAKLAPKW